MTELKEDIKSKLKRLTDKKNIVFVKRGNAAVLEITKLAKKLGKEKVIIQDQGGWITYKQFAGKQNLMCIEIKTDYGLTNLEDLEKKAAGIIIKGKTKISCDNSDCGLYGEHWRCYKNKQESCGIYREWEIKERQENIK